MSEYRASRWPRDDEFSFAVAPNGNLSLSLSHVALAFSLSLSLSHDNGVLSVVAARRFFSHSLLHPLSRSLSPFLLSARVIRRRSCERPDVDFSVCHNPTTSEPQQRLPLYGGKDAADEIRPSVASRCREKESEREQYLLFPFFSPPFVRCSFDRSFVRLLALAVSLTHTE